MTSMRWKPYTDCIPVQIPEPPSPEYLGSLSIPEREEVFSGWEQSAENALETNRRNFKNAMPRIKLCAFLHGLSYPYNRNAWDRHYTWCPSPCWKP